MVDGLLVVSALAAHRQAQPATQPVDVEVEDALRKSFCDGAAWEKYGNCSFDISCASSIAESTEALTTSRAAQATGVEEIAVEQTRARAAIAAWNQRTRPAAEGVLAEAVARIIALDRWSLYDHWATKVGMRPDFPSRMQAVIAPSLAQADAILALLPKPVEGEIDDGPIRIAIWNVLRNDGVSDERCYRLINAVCKALPTPTSDGVRDDG